MGREYGKAGSSGLVLLWCSQGPKGNGSAAKLCEPTLELRLRSIVRQARHVKDLAALRKESTNISASVHGPGQDIGVLVGRLRLADEPTKDTSQSHGFFHGPTRRSGSESLQVERQIVLDRSAGLNRFNL